MWNIDILETQTLSPGIFYYFSLFIFLPQGQAVQTFSEELSDPTLSRKKSVSLQSLYWYMDFIKW